MTPTRAGSIPSASSIACSRRSRRRPIPASSSRSPTARAVRKAAQKLGRFDPGQAAVGHPLRRQGQHRRRRPADDGRLPGLRLHAQDERDAWWSARWPPARCWSARPTSTSSPPAWSACARPIRCPGTPSIRPSCRADRARARPSPWRAGWCRFALGTDTAGSGRVPAGLNNIVGLKPSVGAVSTSGVVPACSTLDCVSVFAGTVDDAWAALRGDGRQGRGRSVLATDRARTPRAPCRRAASSAFRARPTRSSSATRRRERPGEAALQVLKDLGAEFVEIDMAPFNEVAGAALRGPLGGRALCRHPRRSSPSTRARCIP